MAKYNSLEDVRGKFYRMTSEAFGLEPNELNDTLKYIEDLKADSLEMVEMTMKCEEEFDIQITDKDAERLRTLGETVNYIWNKINTTSQNPA